MRGYKAHVELLEITVYTLEEIQFYNQVITHYTD